MANVKSYKWMLRRGGKKMRCPQCGQMRFVPYVLAADGQTLAGEEFGRCDRECNCGYHYYPNSVKAPNVEPVERKQEEPIFFYPAAVETDPRTNLFEYTARLVGTRHALAIWKRYHIGKDGDRTVFWQIAIDGTVRAGKSIPYLPNGHRDKTDKYPANWLHKSKAWTNYYTGKELHQCWFGEHLLRNNDLPVVIVESEKTAAIMSEFAKNYVWLASGGAQGLQNDEKNKVLQGRDVWLLPDNGMYWKWYGIAQANGWNIFDTLEKIEIVNPQLEGCDILDLVELGALGDDLLKHAKK